MGGIEIFLLVVAAVILAVNQGLRDAPALTGKLQFLRPKGWWNYIPLVLVVAAGLVWLSPTFPEAVSESVVSGASETTPRTSLDPNVLPASVSQSYVELMAGDHTDLQEQRFFAAHVGKSMELNLKLASIEHAGASLRGQFYAGRNPLVFVSFPREWEDHLLPKNVGDVVHFQAKIVDRNGRGYGLMDAKPL